MEAKSKAYQNMYRRRSTKKFLNFQKHVIRDVKISVRFVILRTRVIVFYFMTRILQRDGVGIFLSYLT